MSNDCIFCKIVNKTLKTSIEYEDDDIIAFNDINPKAPVHVLIIPKKHIEKINEMSLDDTVLAGKLLMAAKEIAKTKNIDKNGFRVTINSGMDAGQDVGHVHLHLMGGRKFIWPPG